MSQINIPFPDCQQFPKEYEKERKLMLRNPDYFERQNEIRKLFRQFCTRKCLPSPKNPDFFVGVLMFLSSGEYDNYHDLVLDWAPWYNDNNADREDTKCACSHLITKMYQVINESNKQVAIVGCVCIGKIYRDNLGITVQFSEQVRTEAKFAQLEIGENQCSFCRGTLMISKKGKKYCPCYFLSDDDRADNVIIRGQRLFLKNCLTCEKEMRLTNTDLYKDKCSTCWKRGNSKKRHVRNCENCDEKMILDNDELYKTLCIDCWKDENL